jgi:glycerophosphoryl diester phosphodiesterase
MQNSMKATVTVPALARSVWHDYRRTWATLGFYEILFKLLEAWLFFPAVALALSAVLSRAGHIAVSNRDILDFLLSPTGLLYAALFGTVAAALLLLEQAGIMVLADHLTGAAKRPPVGQLLRAAFRHMWRVVRLAAVKVALLTLACVPFVLLGALTYGALLTQHDINFYLTDRPPAFWLAAGIGTLLLLGAVATAMFLYVRWAFALPILLFEGQRVRAALRASRQRVRGAGWRVGLLLFGWLLGTLLLGAALEAGFRLFAAAALANAGERPIALLLPLLVAQGGLVAAMTFVTIVGLGLVTRRLYLLRSEQLGFRPGGWETAPGTETPASPWVRRLAYLSMAIFLLTPLAVWVAPSRYVAVRPSVKVTAHRGHSLAAPENTLSAVRKAIESGADYAEVDVQQTADGVVVLLHDSDLKRVAGVPRAINEMTYDEVRKLEVGSWFDSSFAGEPVPTLAEVIGLCRGRIKLNIELKFYGPDRRLAGEVARLVREQDFESDSLVTSMNYDALPEAKRVNPHLRTGLIVAFALGDVSRLEVEALSVRADWLSDELLYAAHRHGQEVHVWTVNEAGPMARLIKRGADNIITDDPDLGIRVRDEWASVTGTEQLLLASRLLLGLEP